MKISLVKLKALNCSKNGATKESAPVIVDCSISTEKHSKLPTKSLQKSLRSRRVIAGQLLTIHHTAIIQARDMIVDLIRVMRVMIADLIQVMIVMVGRTQGKLKIKRADPTQSIHIRRVIMAVLLVGS